MIYHINKINYNLNDINNNLTLPTEIKQNIISMLPHYIINDMQLMLNSIINKLYNDKYYYCVNGIIRGYINVMYYILIHYLQYKINDINLNLLEKKRLLCVLTYLNDINHLIHIINIKNFNNNTIYENIINYINSGYGNWDFDSFIYFNGL